MTTGRVSIAPAGEPEDGDGWQAVGTLTSDDWHAPTLCREPPWWQNDLDAVASPGVIRFDATANVDLDALRAMFGSGSVAHPAGHRPTHRVEVDYIAPGSAGPPPRKRKGLTGKAYRAARRAHQRRRKAARRGLLPPRMMRIVMPHAHVDARTVTRD